MNELSNAYSVSQEIQEQKENIARANKGLSNVAGAQGFITAATFVIYLSFASVLFAGVPVWNLQDFLFGNKANVIALLWSVAIILLVPIGLSLAKHANYKAIAVEQDRTSLAVRLIITLAIFSGVYYEAISSSANLQAKAFYAVENSKSGQSIMGTTVSSSSSAGIAGLIADAEFKLKACERKVKDGIYKDCDNSTARLESLKAQADAERESVATANVAAIGAKQEALSKEREEHALPLAKWISEAFNISVDGGTMLVVLLAALLFELIHAHTIRSERSLLKNIETANGQLKRLNADYFNQTGKPYTDGDFQDARKIDFSDQPLNFHPEKAEYNHSPVFKYQGTNDAHQNKPSQSIGFIQTDNRKPSTADQKRQNLEKWSAALAARGIPFTGHDEAMERDASDETIRNILGDVPTTPETTTPHYPKATTQRGSEKASNQGSDSEMWSLYPEWLEKVREKAIRPSSEPFNQFFFKRMNTQGKGKDKLKSLWDDFCMKAVADGVLKHNPDFKQGNRKPKYILA